MKSQFILLTVFILCMFLLSGCAYSHAANTNGTAFFESNVANVTPSFQANEQSPVNDDASQKIIFYGEFEQLFEKAIKTAQDEGFEAVYCSTVDEVNAQKNIKGIISVLSFIHKPDVTQIWIGTNFNDVPQDTAAYKLTKDELAQDFINNALIYPPHDTPVRLIGVLTPASEVKQEFDANVDAGKIYPKAVYTSDIPIEEWINQTLDTFPEGTIDGVIASTAKDALLFYNALKYANRDDMEIFCNESSVKVLRAYFEAPEVLASYVGITKDTVNNASIDIITAINQDLALESKEIAPSIMIDETVFSN